MLLLLLELVYSTANLLIVFVLQADILDVNQIFRDLGMLIHEQGEVVGNVLFSLALRQLFFLFLA